MGLFAYSSYYTRERTTSRITRELAETIADMAPSGVGMLDWERARDLRRLGFNNTDSEYLYQRGVTTYTPNVYRRHYDAALFALTDGLPMHWWCDVSQVQNERADTAAQLRLQLAIDDFEAPAPIKRHLRESFDRQERGLRAPELRDLTGLKPVRPYTPRGGCGARLMLSKSILYRLSQESYADHTGYLVPVEGEILDADICRSNLAGWCEAIRTHNGFAGSGSSWTATLVIDPDGAYVELDARHSISD